ncbi:MAG: caspase family protein [Muribaculaceae bacterium]|nr:caspase family protein [Muribaculaceae bacterium]
MKRLLLTLAATALATTAMLAAESTVQGGVKYEVINHSEASCKAAKAGDKTVTEITVMPLVMIDGAARTVTEVQEDGFRGCKYVKKLVLPNTIKKIGPNAFRDCKSLVSVTLPDEAEVELSLAVYDNGGNGPFYGCSVLSDVRGNTVSTPLYVLNKAFIKCKNVPFYKDIPMLMKSVLAKSSMANVDQQVPAFSEFAKDRVRNPLRDWKRRKPYESAEQFAERVTPETTQDKTLALVTDARSEYIRLYAPISLQGVVGEYDADYNMFEVETPLTGSFYVKVPADQAKAFKESFSSVKLEPTYGIYNDKLAVVRCKVSLGGIEYEVPAADELDTEELAKVVLYDGPSQEALIAAASQAAAPAAPAAPAKKTITSPVDKNIPSSGVDNSRTFAVIIGNENYQRGIAEVPFAMHDAETFAKYCNKTLGLPQKNIRSYENATYGDLLAAVRDISNISNAYDGDVDIIFYYAGHGIPDEQSREAYLLPVDADGTAKEVCYPVKRLYDELGGLESRSVTIFLDACFSGATRGEEMLAQARGVMIKPGRTKPVGNMVIFSATNGDQAAFPYKENGHGLFTYYLLEKLQQTQGHATLGELSDYVSEQVSKQSLVVNRKSQTPTVNVGVNFLDTWKDRTLLPMPKPVVPEETEPEASAN